MRKTERTVRQSLFVLGGLTLAGTLFAVASASSLEPQARIVSSRRDGGQTLGSVHRGQPVTGSRLFEQPTVESIPEEVTELLPAVEPPLRLKQPRKINCSERKCIALTFDDGPNQTYGPAVLDALEAHKARATFFFVGVNIHGRDPALVERHIRAGHEIGNHSWGHPILPNLTDDQIREQFHWTNVEMTAITGESPKIYRPPYGLTDDRVRRIGDELGMQEELWNIDTEDWGTDSPHQIYDSVMHDAKPNGVVLMHSINSGTATALPWILNSLEEQGYTFVTISELRGQTVRTTQ